MTQTNAQTTQNTLEVSLESAHKTTGLISASEKHQAGPVPIDLACISPDSHDEFWELVNGLIEEGPDDEELAEAIAGLEKTIRTKNGTAYDAVKSELSAFRYVQRLRSAQDAATKPKMAKGARVPTSEYRPETMYATVVKIGGEYIYLKFPEYPDIEEPNRSTCKRFRSGDLYPAKGSYDKVACFDGVWYVETASGAVHEITRDLLDEDVDDWFLTRCERKPGCWLALDVQFDALTFHEDKSWTGETQGAIEANLPRECVTACFTPDFVAQCRASVGMKQSVLQGVARLRSASVNATSRDVSSKPSGADATRPVIRYPQGAKDTCVFSGAASAMHDYGYPHEAAQLSGEHAQASLSAKDRLVFLHDTVRQKIAGFTAQMLKGSYDPLTDDSPHPVCFAPRGSDNSTNHAVCKLGAWLYDSSRDRALPFDTDANKRNSLDLCVREKDSDTAIYTGVVKGVRIVPGEKLLKRKMGEGVEAPKAKRERAE